MLTLPEDEGVYTIRFNGALAWRPQQTVDPLLGRIDPSTAPANSGAIGLVGSAGTTVNPLILLGGQQYAGAQRCRVRCP